MAEAFGFPFKRTVNFTGAYGAQGDAALPILESQLFDGGLTLTATNYTNASTFGAHTITPGAVSLSATIYADGDIFGAASVSQAGGPQSLTGTLYADPDTFGAATVAATYSLTATRYADADTFGAHTVTPGAVTLAATLYGDPDSFGAHTVTVGSAPAQSLTATLIADGDTFGSHAVSLASGPQDLTATLFENSSAFGAHTITGGEVITLRRGDDAPSARERFWRAKQDEWEEQALKRVARAVSKPKKARKRFVADFLREIKADAVAASFGPPRLDTVIAGLSQPTPDYTALAAVVAAQLAEIEAERVQRRRKRDLEALLLLAA